MRLPPAPPRRGLSFIEIIVLLAGLAVLVGLLLVGLVRLRDASRRAECTNNLRQLALATHSHHDVHGVCPPVWGQVSGTSQGGGTLGPTFFHLLPFLSDKTPWHQAFAYNAAGVVDYHFWHSGYDRAGNVLFTVFDQPPPLEVFICPADPSFPKGGVSPYSNLGSCSYAVNYLALGGVWQGKYEYPQSRNATLKGSFPDGLGATFLYTERLAQCGDNSNSGGVEGMGWDYPFVQETNNLAPAFAAWGAIKRSYPGSREFRPEDQLFQTRPLPWDRACNPSLASTGHYQGICVALADASTRVVAPSVGGALWWAGCTPDGRDAFPPEE